MRISDWSSDVCSSDLRNFCDFSKPLPQNPHYGALHGLLIPQSWPPSAENETAIQAFRDVEGEQAYRQGVMLGQYTHADGLFYGGQAPSWSNRTLRHVLAHHERKRTKEIGRAACWERGCRYA